MQGIIRPRLTKIELSSKLKNLAKNMNETAKAMAYYGDHEEHWEQHCKELLGAAEIARSWALGIEKEHQEEVK